MPRYVDAEKLEKDGWSASRTYQQDAKTMVYETKKMTDFPTADVVEVVRCKECKHRDGEDGQCPLQTTGDPYLDTYPQNNFYCGDGERRKRCGSL